MSEIIHFSETEIGKKYNAKIKKYQALQDNGALNENERELLYLARSLYAYLGLTFFNIQNNALLVTKQLANNLSCNWIGAVNRGDIKDERV